MDTGKHIYFLSDAHLGTPNPASSRDREDKLVQFLHEIAPRAEKIFILGDLFDFWFEYKRVVPKGFTRLLGTLAGLTDQGIEIHFFTGNHDLWTFGYLEEEIGLVVHRKPASITLGTKRFFMGHGDGLDARDHRFNFIKWVFTNRFFQRAFSILHPNFAIRLANAWSRSSRLKHGDQAFLGEQEPLVQYSRNHLVDQGFDFIVFGHRHCPADYSLTDHTRLIFLGDWMKHFSYGEFDGTKMEIKTKDQGPKVR